MLGFFITINGVDGLAIGVHQCIVIELTQPLNTTHYKVRALHNEHRTRVDMCLQSDKGIFFLILETFLITMFRIEEATLSI